MQFERKNNSKKTFFFLLFLLTLITQRILSEYQFYAHLRGDGTTNVKETIDENNIGKYSENHEIGGLAHPTSIQFSKSEILYGFGIRNSGKVQYSDQLWIYSIEKNQWKFMKGRRNNEDYQTSSFTETHKFHSTNEIGSRYLGNGWKEDDESNIFTFFGGKGNLKTVDQKNLNELYRYNTTSNSYAVIFCNDCGVFSIPDNSFSFVEPYKYSSSNYPTGRQDFEAIKINDDEVLIVGGVGDYWFGDWWIYSNQRTQFKYMGGDPTDQEISVFGETNVYHKNNTFGSTMGHRGVMINEEEILFYGGRKKMNAGYSAPCSVVQKYNISGNVWKYISGKEKTTETYTVFPARSYQLYNFPIPRNRHQLYKINADEILMTFGSYEDSSFFNDQWTFSISSNLWKFTGKDSTVTINDMPSSFSENSFDMFFDDTIPGGMQSFGVFFGESNDVFMCVGLGSSQKYLNDCWRLYIGNVCNSRADNDPLACPEETEACVAYNSCESECFGLLEGNQNVCSANGNCSKGICYCNSNLFYINEDDCSTDQFGFFIATYSYIFLIIAFVIIISLIGVILVLVFIFIIRKLKKRLQKFDQIDDVDIILEEQKMNKDNSVAKFKINKKFFEIDPKDVTVIKKIGEGGGSGVVFLAEWNKQKVGYKCFEVKEFLDENKFEEFEKEVQMLSSISFPFVLTFYGATLNTQRLGFVMEFAENGDLENFLKKYKKKNGKSYPLKEKFRMLNEIASAMLFIHNKKVIHRDLKPMNVLVTSKEETKLMDFGLSKIINGESVTRTKKIGTSFYMAPEVLKGKYSFECDVYSFAMLVYVVLTEIFSPYKRSDLQNIGKLLTKRPDIEEIKKLELSNDIKNMITRNWDADPSQRMKFSEISDFFEGLVKG